MLQQGLVLLVAGMAIAIGFLFLLSIVTTLLRLLAKHVNFFPEPVAKKAPATPVSDEEAIAVAIAVASGR